jgi:hypothetical protein
LKIIESTSYQPRAAAPLALPRRAFGTGMGTSWDGPDEVVLATPRSTGKSPFLAQYLAQEFFAADGQPPRWRERDSAYRLANEPTTPPFLSVDI